MKTGFSVQEIASSFSHSLPPSDTNIRRLGFCLLLAMRRSSLNSVLWNSPWTHGLHLWPWHTYQRHGFQTWAAEISRCEQKLTFLALGFICCKQMLLLLWTKHESFSFKRWRSPWVLRLFHSYLPSCCKKHLSSSCPTAFLPRHTVWVHCFTQCLHSSAARGQRRYGEYAESAVLVHSCSGLQYVSFPTVPVHSFLQPSNPTWIQALTKKVDI